MFLFPSEEDLLSFFSVGFHGCGDPVFDAFAIRCPPNFFPLVLPYQSFFYGVGSESFDWMSTVVASRLILYVCLLSFFSKTISWRIYGILVVFVCLWLGLIFSFSPFRPCSRCCSVSWWRLGGKYVPVCSRFRPPVQGLPESKWSEQCQPSVRNGRQLHCFQHSQQ